MKTTRDRVITIKLTDAEKKKIIEAAELLGMTLSTYVRWVLITAGTSRNESK